MAGRRLSGTPGSHSGRNEFAMTRAIIGGSGLSLRPMRPRCLKPLSRHAPLPPGIPEWERDRWPGKGSGSGSGTNQPGQRLYRRAGCHLLSHPQWRSSGTMIWQTCRGVSSGLAGCGSMSGGWPGCALIQSATRIQPTRPLPMISLRKSKASRLGANSKTSTFSMPRPLYFRWKLGNGRRFERQPAPHRRLHFAIRPTPPQHEFEIQYGRDLRNWWWGGRGDSEAEADRGKVVWIGTNATSRRYEAKIQAVYEHFRESPTGSGSCVCRFCFQKNPLRPISSGDDSGSLPKPSPTNNPLMARTSIPWADSRREAGILRLGLRTWAMILCLMNEAPSDDSSSGAGKGSFPTTHWSALLAAGYKPGAKVNAALGELCATYWYPLYAFARRNGRRPADAQDLTRRALRSPDRKATRAQGRSPERPIPLSPAGLFQGVPGFGARTCPFATARRRHPHRAARILRRPSGGSGAKRLPRPPRRSRFDGHWAVAALDAALARLELEMRQSEPRRLVRETAARSPRATRTGRAMPRSPADWALLKEPSR